MTHIANIPHILANGITHASSKNANPNYVPIGDVSLIKARANATKHTINDTEFCPSNFIPFYFYARMPMLYNIQHGYNVAQVNAEDIVYLIVDLIPIISDPNRVYYFSDGHAICKTTKFYGKEYINQIDSLLDKNAILATVWSDDYMIREHKQAEFLVGGDIPTEYITHICCYNNATKNKLYEMGVTIPIIVKPDAYY